MAADVWKVKDMYGRVFLYENQKSFERRYKSSIGEYHDRLAWMQQNPHSAGVWIPKQPEGYRIENDVWETQQLDKNEMKVYLDKREAKRMKREARIKGYRA